MLKMHFFWNPGQKTHQNPNLLVSFKIYKGVVIVMKVPLRFGLLRSFVLTCFNLIPFVISFKMSASFCSDSNMNWNKQIFEKLKSGSLILHDVLAEANLKSNFCLIFIVLNLKKILNVLFKGVYPEVRAMSGKVVWIKQKKIFSLMKGWTRLKIQVKIFNNWCYYLIVSLIENKAEP